MPFVCKSTIYIFDKSLFKFDNQTICKSEWQMIKELQDINWKLFGLPCTYSTAKTALFIYCWSATIPFHRQRYTYNRSWTQKVTQLRILVDLLMHGRFNVPWYTVQFLAGFVIKTVRTVLNSRGIHRLLVSFRANFITYNFQTFFLPQGKKLWNDLSVFFSSF